MKTKHTKEKFAKSNIFIKFVKGLAISLLSVFLLSSGLSFAQDLNPSHRAYNSLTSVLNALKLDRITCTDIGYYPQVGQALCANVPTAENFREDWDLIVSTTGASFGLSPLGDWTSEPTRGIIHRIYLLGDTDLKINYDVISSRVTIDILDPELQAETTPQQASSHTTTAQPTNTVQASTSTSTTSTNTAGTTTASTTSYVATNSDGTTFALQATPAQATTTHTAQAQTGYPQTTTAAHTATSSALVSSQAYAPATPQTSSQVNPADTSSGYPSTATTNYTHVNTGNQVAQPTAAQTTQQAYNTQASQAASTNYASTATYGSDYAYTPTNLVSTMGTANQNSSAFTTNGAWQITSSGNPVTMELYDSTTQTFVRTVYANEVYRDAGNYYLTITGSASWAVSVWTE